MSVSPDVASLAGVTNYTNTPPETLTPVEEQGLNLILIVLIIQFCLADRNLLIDDCLSSLEVSEVLLLGIPDGLNMSQISVTTVTTLQPPTVSSGNFGHTWNIWSNRINWCVLCNAVTMFDWQASKSTEIPQFSYNLQSRSKLQQNCVSIRWNKWGELFSE